MPQKDLLIEQINALNIPDSEKYSLWKKLLSADSPSPKTVAQYVWENLSCSVVATENCKWESKPNNLKYHSAVEWLVTEANSMRGKDFSSENKDLTTFITKAIALEKQIIFSTVGGAFTDLLTPYADKKRRETILKHMDENYLVNKFASDLSMHEPRSITEGVYYIAAGLKKAQLDKLIDTYTQNFREQAARVYHFILIALEKGLPITEVPLEKILAAAKTYPDLKKIISNHPVLLKAVNSEAQTPIRAKKGTLQEIQSEIDKWGTIGLLSSISALGVESILLILVLSVSPWFALLAIPCVLLFSLAVYSAVTLNELSKEKAELSNLQQAHENVVISALEKLVKQEAEKEKVASNSSLPQVGQTTTSEVTEKNDIMATNNNQNSIVASNSASQPESNATELKNSSNDVTPSTDKFMKITSKSQITVANHPFFTPPTKEYEDGNDCEMQEIIQKLA